MGKVLVLKCEGCKCCPRVERVGDEIVIADADQTTPGTVRLTKKQFEHLVTNGKDLLE